MGNSESIEPRAKLYSLKLSEVKEKLTPFLKHETPQAKNILDSFPAASNYFLAYFDCPHMECGGKHPNISSVIESFHTSVTPIRTHISLTHIKSSCKLAFTKSQIEDINNL